MSTTTRRQRAGRRRQLALGLAIALAAVLSVPASGARAPAGRAISGSWRVYSARLSYDAGGGTDIAASLRPLTISGRRWHWGSSSGRIAIKPIVAADWKRWRVKPYGPRQKVVFGNWLHGRAATGPIESASGRVVFLWVVYHVTRPTVQAPGIVYLKFGRAHP